jgi:RNA-splicing ligase RtcB
MEWFHSLNQIGEIMADLKIFAKTVEQEVHDQLKQLLSVDVFKDAKIRIMPDTHAGKGCVIGFTADLGDKVVPNLVGVDIGCNLYVVNLGKLDLSDERLAELDKFIRDNIPSGMNVNDSARTVGFDRLQDLKMFSALRNVEHLQASVGSLGSGNHYLELDKDSSGDVYLCIHSGSRNLGQQVCRYYQKLAVDNCLIKSNEFKGRVAYLATKMKLEGQQKEIQSAIGKLKKEYKCEDSVQYDLCYLEGVHRDDYLHDMKICQEYAKRNTEEIARRILEFLKVDPIESFHTVHNYIDFEDNIIRKGAIRCNKGEKVIIPLNMKDGSIIGIGKGNEDWNCSGPHGAGRLMSRKQAKQSVSMNDFKESMEGIFTTSMNESTLDESPMAYKPADEIIELVKDTIDVIEVIKPIYNFKHSD